MKTGDVAKLPSILKFPPGHKLKQTTQFSNNAKKLQRQQQPDLSLGLPSGSLYSDEDSHCKETLLTAISPSINTSSLPENYLSMPRSTSLPADAEKDKEKAMSSMGSLLRRGIEATDRFVIKQRMLRRGIEKEKSPVPSSPSNDPAWAAASASESPAICHAMDRIRSQACFYAIRKHEGPEGSAGGNVPTGADIKTVPGMSSNGESVMAAGMKLENTCKKVKLSISDVEDIGMDIMRQMPSVTTMGNGPGGKQIEGVLYQYRRGEVRIVCVCHGNFLTPEEFIKHAGHTDISNPMKHITVWPASLYF